MTTIDSIKPARLNLRFDETLRRQLEAAAKRTERSLNREVIYRLKKRSNASRSRPRRDPRRSPSTDKKKARAGLRSAGPRKDID